MALTRDRKGQIVEEYGKRLERASVVVWAGYKGLTASETQRLRRRLDGVNAEAMVVKNTLMGLAMKRAGLPVSDELMKGNNLVTFVYGDIAPAVKTVADFAIESREKMAVKGGVVGGRVANAQEVIALITLPSREVLLAQVLGGLQAPVTGLVSVLAGVVRSVMNVLNARAEQLEGSAS